MEIKQGFEIIVKNIGNNTEVSKCLDPLFDAKLLLEGVGVLIDQISKFSKTQPKELKKEVWNMDKKDVLKMLHEYLDLVGKDYKDTQEVYKLTNRQP